MSDNPFAGAGQDDTDPDPFAGPGQGADADSDSNPFAGPGQNFSGFKQPATSNGAGARPANAQLGPWAAARLPASWRGIQFRVRESEVKRGRRQAVHEYAFRDDVWVEDLGRAPRVTSFRGFLVGDDVDKQLQAMIDAAETPGPGTLIHPALGSLNVALLEFTASDSADAGRTYALEFVFQETAQRLFPSAAVDTQSKVSNAADAASDATADAFSGVGTTLDDQADDANPFGGAGTVLPGQSDENPFAGAGTTLPPIGGVTNAPLAQQGLQTTIGGWVSTVTSLSRDVGAIASAAGVQGNFGRFSLGARLASAGVTNPATAASNANAARASVDVLGAVVTRLAGKL